MNNFKLTEDEILFLWRLEKSNCFPKVEKVFSFCSVDDKEYNKFLDSLYFSLAEKGIFSWYQKENDMLSIKVSAQEKLIMKLIFLTLPKEIQQKKIIFFLQVKIYNITIDIFIIKVYTIKKEMTNENR